MHASKIEDNCFESSNVLNHILFHFQKIKINKTILINLACLFETNIS